MQGLEALVGRDGEQRRHVAEVVLDLEVVVVYGVGSFMLSRRARVLAVLKVCACELKRAVW